MVQALLEILARCPSAEISKLREDTTIMHTEPCCPGAFPKLRLLSTNYEVLTCLGQSLCRSLISNPPHEFLWMKRVPEDRINLLVRIMSVRSFSRALQSISSDALFKQYESDILAARGCVAHGLLFHCLMARHRVGYGVVGSSRKLAVPFSASDTPKVRADFSHPDVAIIYTCLSYFYDGLSKMQFKEVLACLQNMGPTAQQNVYDSWIDDIRKDAGAFKHDVSSFDNILKVDIENKLQLDLMHSTMGFSMKVISFWLDNFVFPTETHVFPARRVSSAWNLVDSGTSIGFSGTDDNRFLLPLNITQMQATDRQLQATNGEMIDRILSCTRHIEVLDDSNAALWQVVL